MQFHFRKLYKFIWNAYLTSFISLFLSAFILLFLYAIRGEEIFLYLSILLILLSIIRINNTVKLLVFCFFLGSLCIFFNNVFFPKSLDGGVFEVEGVVRNVSSNIELVNAKIDGKLVNKRLYIELGSQFAISANQYEIFYGKGNLLESYRTDGFIIRKEHLLFAETEENVISKNLPKITSFIENIFKNNLIENNGVALAMTFGLDDSLDADSSKVFRDLGLSHVLVASGANIILVIGLVEFVTKFFGSFLTKKLTSVCSVVLYFLIVGIQASIVRALLFYSLGLLKIYTGREINRLQLVQITIILSMLFVPSLVLSVGYILSMSAVLSIFLSSDLVKLLRLTKIQAFLVQNSIIVFIVNVITAFYFHTFNLTGLVSNVLLIWLIEILVTTSCVYFVIAVFVSPSQEISAFWNIAGRLLDSLYDIYLQLSFNIEVFLDRKLSFYTSPDENVLVLFVITVFIAWVIISYCIFTSRIRNKVQ